MPIYSYWCDKCGKRFEISKSMDLSGRTESCECGSMARRVIDIPAYSGLDSGPGSGEGQMHFENPNPARDIPITLKKMEELGQLNTPEKKAWAKVKYDASKQMVDGGIDYQKAGHALDD